MTTTGGFACAPWLQQHSISTFFLGHPVVAEFCENLSVALDPVQLLDIHIVEFAVTATRRLVREITFEVFSGHLTLATYATICSNWHFQIFETTPVCYWARGMRGICDKH